MIISYDDIHMIFVIFLWYSYGIHRDDQNTIVDLTLLACQLRAHISAYFLFTS